MMDASFPRLHGTSDTRGQARGRGQVRPANMADENSFRLHAPATGKSIADTRCRVIRACDGACTVVHVQCYTPVAPEGTNPRLAPTAR